MFTHSPHRAGHRGGDRTALVAVLVCWLFVVFDGYDLIVYGNVISSLQREWGIGPATAGTLGSLAFVGMMIGAVLAGRLSDAIGRKRAVIGCAVVLSVFTALCALATGPVVFGALRLIAGIGLGGLVPTANALAAELIRTEMARPGRDDDDVRRADRRIDRGTAGHPGHPAVRVAADVPVRPAAVGCAGTRRRSHAAGPHVR